MFRFDCWYSLIDGLLGRGLEEGKGEGDSLAGGSTLEISGWGCATGTLEPLTIPELAQLNFATPY